MVRAVSGEDGERGRWCAHVYSVVCGRPRPARCSLTRVQSFCASSTLSTASKKAPMPNVWRVARAAVASSPAASHASRRGASDRSPADSMPSSSSAVVHSINSCCSGVAGVVSSEGCNPSRISRNLVSVSS
eukprot:7377266-Prymnesium_polylepis.2